MKKIIFSVIIIFISVIFIEAVNAYDEYKLGDKVSFNGEMYHVIENSDSNSDYVTILKDEALSINDLYKYGRDENDNLFVNKYVANSDDLEKVVYEYDNGLGGMAYYTSETCSNNLSWAISRFDTSEKETIGCTNSYQKSDVKRVVDNWSKSFTDSLKEVNGYKARILSYDDLVNSLGFVSLVGNSSYQLSIDTNATWFSNMTAPIWISNTLDDSNEVLILFGFYGLSGRQIYSEPNDFFAAVRPVVNVLKSKVNIVESRNKEEDSLENNKYKEYKKGETVIYKGTLFYVVNDSDENQNYVYLVRALNLSLEQLKKYSGDFDLESNRIYYYPNYGCVRYFSSDCSSSYDDSIVKEVVDNYVKNELDERDLISVNGYKAKILSYDEVMNLLNEYPLEGYNISAYKLKYLLSPEMGYVGGYWLMKEDTSDKVHNYYFGFYAGFPNEFDVIKEEYISIDEHVRPTIYLKKSVLEKKTNPSKNNATNKKYKSYKIGDKISYNGDDYYVIRNSDENESSLTLLKANSLTFDEVNKYKGNLNVQVTDKDGFGLIPYYESETCNRNLDYLETYNCKGSYNSSIIKQVVENWAKDVLNEEDLVYIDSYKVRLLQFSELAHYLGYDLYNLITDYVLKKTEDVPEWVYNQVYKTCTMSQYYDSTNIYRIYPQGEVALNNGDNPGYGFRNNVYDICAVRPVINLDKCALDDGCYDVKKDNSIVDVENTLSHISNFLLVISILLIMFGSIILGYYYLKIKK